MVKIIGFMLILIAGTGLGFAGSRELSRREKNLQALRQLVVGLKGEIGFGVSSIPECFEAVSGRMPEPWTTFLRKNAADLSGSFTYMPRESASGAAAKPGHPDGRGTGLNFSRPEESSLAEICRRNAEDCLSTLCWSSEEKAFVFSLGNRLGYPDKEMQLRQLTIYEEELEQLLNTLRSGLLEKKKLCRALGMLGGIFLVILLW